MKYIQEGFSVYKKTARWTAEEHNGFLFYMELMHDVD